MTAGYLSLTDRDRDEMLAAIGVSSIDDLFAQIPEEVRFAGELDVPPALTEVGARSATSRSSRRRTSTPASSSRSSAPGSTTTTCRRSSTRSSQRGEFLTAYTPYQPEMSQGVLQAIFEYQTAICELTGMDVSNASGYDGFTVAADACFIAKHATGRTQIVLAETLNPQVREVVKTYAPGFGLEVVEVAHEGGVTDPERVAAAARGCGRRDLPAAELLRLPRGRAALAAAAREAGALAVAHVDLTSLGVLEAPGAYGCDIAIGEGQSVGNAQSFGGPHYGFLASRTEFIRRLPGRIVGETTDLNGDRGFVLTLQTREQHIRREKATSNMTTNQTLLALGGLVTSPGSARRGSASSARRACRLAGYARERLALPAAFDQPVFKELAVRTPRPARDVIREARARGVHPGLRARARLRGHGRRAARRADREAHARRHRPPRRRPARRCAADGADLREEPGRAPGGARPELRPAGARGSRRRSRARSRRACRSSPRPRSSATSRTSPTGTSASTRASTRSAPAR